MTKMKIWIVSVVMLLMVMAVLWPGKADRPALSPLCAQATEPQSKVPPAPVNPYQGMQEREEVFEFAQKPKATKQGDKWLITFAATGKCDATVAILGTDGKIVRHLASGVLGKNAPWPFQQDSLTQKLEWDGQDDMGKPVPASCRIRVSLGLRAKFERNIAWNPYFVPSRKEAPAPFVGRGANDELFLLVANDHRIAEGRVFKDGRYVRTFWPPAAGDLEKVVQAFSDKRFRGHYRLVKTVWGDSVPVSEERYGIGSMAEVILGFENLAKIAFEAAGVGEYKRESEAPKLAAKPPADWDGSWFYANGPGGQECPRMAADRYREVVYLGNNTHGLRRMDGKTGKLDGSFYPDGTLNRVTECHVGPDGLLYLGIGGGGYFQYVVRLDHNGKPVDFGGDAVPLPQDGTWHDTGQGMYMGSPRPRAFGKQNIKVLWTGLRNHSNTHERGLFISPRGHILAHILQGGSDVAWSLKYGVPPTAPQTRGAGSFVRVWANDGKLLTSNAVGDMGTGHGVSMDRDGNIYAAVGAIWPAGQKSYDGMIDVAPEANRWGGYGSLVKFRGGTAYPLGRTCYDKKDVPATGAIAVSGRYKALEGAQWIWGGLVCQTDGNCSCHQLRYDMDYFARHWIPSNQLYSITVLDANGNRIARLGRYGNVDDTAQDLKGGKDGLRFVWPRALCVSDTALYVTDHGNRRILKAAISYATEETLPLP
jgi:hypothetical protein